MARLVERIAVLVLLAGVPLGCASGGRSPERADSTSPASSRRGSAHGSGSGRGHPSRIRASTQVKAHAHAPTPTPTRARSAGANALDRGNGQPAGPPRAGDVTASGAGVAGDPRLPGFGPAQWLFQFGQGRAVGPPSVATLPGAGPPPVPAEEETPTPPPPPPPAASRRVPITEVGTPSR